MLLSAEGVFEIRLRADVIAKFVGMTSRQHRSVRVGDGYNWNARADDGLAGEFLQPGCVIGFHRAQQVGIRRQKTGGYQRLPPERLKISLHQRREPGHILLELVLEAVLDAPQCRAQRNRTHHKNADDILKNYAFLKFHKRTSRTQENGMRACCDAVLKLLGYR